MPTFLREALCAQGSTRQLGLLRISLAWLLWASWGYPFILHFDLHGDRVLLAFGFYASAWVLFLGVGSRLASFGTAVFLLIAIWRFGEATAGTIWSQQHRVLVALFALVFAVTPSGRSLSLERWLELRRAARATNGLKFT